jgi:site-specific recombinase XerD
VYVGPLAPYIDGYAAALDQQRFSRDTGDRRLRLIVRLSRWMESRELSVVELGENGVAEFLRGRRRRGIRRNLKKRGAYETARTFLAYLRQLGAIPPAVVMPVKNQFASIEQQLEQYLTQERGVGRRTIKKTLREVRAFLAWRFRRRRVVFADIRAADLARYLLRQASARSPGGIESVIHPLRCFCRFLRLRGMVKTDLAASVPGAATWRLATVPRSLSSDEVEQILRSCNRTTAYGRRDYVVLLLLARLGLRSHEVYRMELDDIDWAAAEIVIRGKGLQNDRVPLPYEVGRAIADYLRRDRPACTSRRLFVTHIAPHLGFSDDSTSVSAIVKRAMRRAGLYSGKGAAHLLRHSLATNLLNRGSRIAEIGLLLRHRSPYSTLIYAKVDLNGLREIAIPWPGDAR